METVRDLFKLCIMKYHYFSENKLKEKWFHKEGEIFAFMRPGDFQYECFIVTGSKVYWFLFNNDGSDFIHVAVRQNNKTIKNSGPVSAEIFCMPSNIRALPLKNITGHVLTDEKYWDDFFKSN